MALHEQCVGATDEWYTPPYIFAALGVEFDLDVASPGAIITPWIPARRFLVSHGQYQEWRGVVWMNPPFGGRNALRPWLQRFVRHGNGIALVPDRTSAPWWQEFTPMMEVVLFVAPKIKFIGVDGEAGRSPAQGTCLMAIGETGVAALHRAAPRLGVLMQCPPETSEAKP
jgi:hypothetical protein